MSDEAKPKAKAGGGKLKKILLLGVGAVVLLGGGVGAGLYASGTGLVGGAAKHQEDPNAPKLIRKGERPAAAEGDHGGGGGGHGFKGPIPPGSREDSNPDPTKYEAAYYKVEQNFTSNLRDSDSFIQVTLGVSTYYDGRVIENLKRNEVPVRSAVLMALGEQDTLTIGTPAGRTGLQRRLKDAINGVLREKEGFGGVADVYFTSFIVQ